MKIGTGIALGAMMTAMTIPSGFAQSSGAEIYKSKCQMCHGAAGLAESGVGKVMKVKPVSDPAVKRMSEEQMIETVRNGAGKMQPYKDKLTGPQIKDSVTYFRTLIK
jgi:mono/diheme cytochrome c family protein